MTTVAFVSGIGEVYDTISHTFTNNASNGVGVADTGQAVTVEATASEWSASSGTGRVSVTSVNVTRRAFLTSFSRKDSDATVTFTIPVVASGATISLGLMPRYIDVSNYVRVDARFQTDTNVVIRTSEQVAGSAINAVTTSTITTYGAASSWKLRYRMAGQLLQAKLWSAGGSEPDGWHAQVLVTSATLADAVGSTGIRIIFETSNTNGTQTIQFDNWTVNSPVQTRLDLNSAPWNLHDPDTDLAPPDLRYATAQTLLSDGSITSAGSYEDRVIRLGLQLTSSDGGADELQALWRELDRPRNWLLWQPAGHEPVFFHTKRAGPDQIREVVGNGDLREIMIEIPADSAGYGLLQTLDTVTVTNDPAAGSNGLFVDIDAAEVKGDLDTPAILRFDYADVEDKGPTAMGMRRRGTPSQAPLFLQAESMTLGTDTTLPGNDAVMSGSGSNYARCSFATVAGTMTVRLTSSVFPAIPSTDARGRYDVYLRCRKSVSGNEIHVQLGQVIGAGTISNDEVTLPSTTERRWIYLGNVQIPTGADPTTFGPSGEELPARGSTFTVSAQRLSGSGNVDFDVLVFVPTCDRPSMVYWPTSSGPTYSVVDGTAGLVYNLGSDGGIYPREAIPVAGQFQWLRPGQDHRLVMLLNGGGLVSDDKASTVDVTVQYFPRYRHAYTVQ